MRTIGVVARSLGERGNHWNLAAQRSERIGRFLVRLPLLLRNSADAILLLDTTLQVRGANSSAELMFTMKINDAVGKQCRDLFQCLSMSGEPQCVARCPVVEFASDSRTSRVLRLTLRTPGVESMPVTMGIQTYSPSRNKEGPLVVLSIRRADVGWASRIGRAVTALGARGWRLFPTIFNVQVIRAIIGEALAFALVHFLTLNPRFVPEAAAGLLPDAERWAFWFSVLCDFTLISCNIWREATRLLQERRED